MEQLLDRIKGEVANEKGYPTWEEMWEWLTREGQLPVVVDQLTDTCVNEVATRYAIAVGEAVKEEAIKRVLNERFKIAPINVQELINKL